MSADLIGKDISTQESIAQLDFRHSEPKVDRIIVDKAKSVPERRIKGRTKMESRCGAAAFDARSWAKHNRSLMGLGSRHAKECRELLGVNAVDLVFKIYNLPSIEVV